MTPKRDVGRNPVRYASTSRRVGVPQHVNFHPELRLAGDSSPAVGTVPGFAIMLAVLLSLLLAGQRGLLDWIPATLEGLDLRAPAVLSDSAIVDRCKGALRAQLRLPPKDAPGTFVATAAGVSESNGLTTWAGWVRSAGGESRKFSCSYTPVRGAQVSFIR
jgi:hypothetical protein